MAEHGAPKIYTRTGDTGETSTLGGPRVLKNAAIVEACGTIDELNSAIGLARTEPLPEAADRLLDRVQHELFALGAEVAATGGPSARFQTISERHVEVFEEAIDRYDAVLPPLRQFVLPGGARGAALLHVARNVCRRAERRLVALSAQSDRGCSPLLIAYVNRLSDLLFTVARAVNAQTGVGDVPWQKQRAPEQGAEEGGA
jgi:cob(I)alamin adenosyltransferase